MAKRNKWKRFAEKLNNLPNWIAVLAVVASFLLGPLAFTAIVSEHGHNIYAIVAMVLCIPPFLYTSFLCVYTLAKAWKSLVKASDKFKFTRNLFKSYEFRSVFFGVCTFVCNVGFTVFLCVMAIMYESPWYGASAVYYILLSTARGGILLQNVREEKKYKDEPLVLAKAKAGTYRYCGIMLVALSIALSLSVLQMFADGAMYRMPAWTVIPFALVALARIGMSVWHFVKATKKDDMVVRAIRYINLSTALVSILTCQTAIFVSFKPPFNTSYANGITGIIVCIVNMSLGVFMITYAHEVRKRLKAKQAEMLKESAILHGYNREEYGDEYGLEVIKELLEEDSEQGEEQEAFAEQPSFKNIEEYDKE